MLRRLLPSAAITLAACSFDPSALEGRLCAGPAECLGGTCIDGVCVLDLDAANEAGPDADLDGRDDGDAASPPDGSGDSDTTADAAPDLPDADDVAPDAVDPCAPVGRACRDGAVYECRPDGAEVLVLDCDDQEGCGEYGCRCAGVACLPRTCQPGARQCDGDVPLVCVEDGALIEREEACVSGDVCVDGFCVPGTCEPASVLCVDGAAVACDDEGAVVSVEDCSLSGARCLERDGVASCVPQICVPGTRSCAEPPAAEAVLECEASGTEFVLVEACTGDSVCVGDRCAARVCEPDARSCAGEDAVRVCDARGTTESVVPCEAGEICLVDTCVSVVCEPGATRCAAGGVEACDATGTLWSEAVSCGDGRACFEGACLETACPPSVVYCEGAERRRCAADGLTSTLLETCAWACLDGACTTNVCGDGRVDPASEVCDDGNTRGCDGCEACGRLAAITSGAGAATTAGPTWIPNESDFTLEAWVNVTGTGGALFGLGRESDTDFASVRVSDGAPVFIVRLDNGQTVAMRGDFRLTGAGWVHLAAVRFDRTALALFVNGALVGIHRGQTDRTRVDNTSGRIWVGSDGVQAPAAAQIDEYRVSARRRYQFTFAPPRRHVPDGDTRALFHMDEGTGDTLRNEAGGGNITLSGGSWIADSCYGSAGGRLVCGDGTRSALEACDDGNTRDGDGCSGICTVETRCRSGVQRPGAGEGGGCYVRNTTTQDWGDAVESCEAWGGTLVTINDAAENQWLFERFGAGLWIGATDESGWGDGEFRWVSGQPFGYRNWGGGQPDDGGTWGSEDCVELAGGGAWNDLGCNESRWAICESGG